MPVKPPHNQPRQLFQVTLLLLGALAVGDSTGSDIKTLFTTPMERQIINANRYKNDDIVKAPVVEERQTEFIAPVAKEEVTASYAISGITISNSGPHSVWINNLVYEDGEHLEDNSHIKVLIDDNIRVRITTPDGKNYYATSGEIVEATYMATVEN